MAAQNVGAGLWSRVDAVARTGIAANFLMTGLLIALLIGFDRWTLALFLPEGSATLDIARHLNHIAIWSFLLFGVSFVVSGVVRSTGAVIPPLLILAFSLWGVRVPLANFLVPHLGADAVWWSFPISSTCSMLLSLAYYRWGGWRKARMLATPTHPSALAAPAEVPAHPASPVADTAPTAERTQTRSP
jgi:Na+-driven multidrug efflux pump